MKNSHLYSWFLNQFTDYQWARQRLEGQWQKWVPENGENQGFWVQGFIVSAEIATILKFKGRVYQYVATNEVEIYF